MSRHAKNGAPYKVFLKTFPSFMMTTKFFAGSSMSLMLAIGSPLTSRRSASAPSSTTPSSPGYGLRLPDSSSSWAFVPVAMSRRNGAFNFDWLANADWPQLSSQRRPHGLACGELADSIRRGGIAKDD